MKKHLAQQTRLWDYHILNKLGKGQYGEVFQVQHKKTKQLFALKKMTISSSHVHTNLSSKNKKYRPSNKLNVLSFYHILLLSSINSHFFQWIIFILSCSMPQRVILIRIIQVRKRKQKYYKEQELWDLFQQIVKGVKYLHEKDIVHRDIKTQNIFCMENNKPKIGDLGMSKILQKHGDLISTRVGTPIYFAPQIIQNQMYSFPVDIWALGCVFYNLIMLEHPFQQASISTLAYYIIDKDPKPIKGYYSPQLISIVKQCLIKDPKQRINVFDLAIKIKNRNVSQPINKISIFNIKHLSLFANSPMDELTKIKSKQENYLKKQLRLNQSQDYKNSRQLGRRYRGQTASVVLKESCVNNAESPTNSQRCCSSINSPRKKMHFFIAPRRIDKQLSNSKNQIGKIKSMGFSQLLIQKKDKIKVNNVLDSVQMSPQKNQNSYRPKLRKSFF